MYVLTLTSTACTFTAKIMYKLKLQRNSRLYFVNSCDLSFPRCILPFAVDLRTVRLRKFGFISFMRRHRRLYHDACMWKIDLIWTPWRAPNKEERPFFWRMALNCCERWAQCIRTSTLCRGYRLLNFDDFYLFFLLSILHRNTHKWFEWYEFGNRRAFCLFATNFHPSQTNKCEKKI